MTAIALITILATVLSVEDQYATVDAGLIAGIRPGDAAVIYYLMPVGSEKRTVVVSRGEVIEAEDHRSVLLIESEFTVLPGYSVEFEIPQDRVEPRSLVDLARSRIVQQSSAETRLALLDKLIPEDALIEEQILRLIQDRRRQRRAAERVAVEPKPRAERPHHTSSPPPSAGAFGGEMEAMVLGWIEAWAEQRADDYLAFYARDYRPPHGMDRGRWEAERRARLSQPAFIKLALDFKGSEANGDGSGWVRFEQSYRSDFYSDEVLKRLELVREDGGWKIRREVVERQL